MIIDFVFINIVATIYDLLAVFVKFIYNSAVLSLDDFFFSAIALIKRIRKPRTMNSTPPFNNKGDPLIKNTMM